MLIPELLHAFSATIAIVLSGLGSGIGQGIAGLGAINAMNRQGMGNESIMRAMILGLALTESGAILALVITLMTLFGGFQTVTLGIGLAELGAGIAIGMAAATVSIASSFAVYAACHSIARQPFFSQRILTLMLLVQSIIEAPAVFAFITALIIKANIYSGMSTLEGVRLLAAGLTVGVGAIGPSIGQAIFSYASCKAAGLNKESFGKLFTYTLFSQAIIETPVLFCMIVAMILIFKPLTSASVALTAIVYMVTAFTISAGSTGPAISTGYAASKSCIPVVLNSKHYPLFMRTTLLAQAIIESSVIYALIIALLLLTMAL